jgi:hypothetical protein
MTPGNENISLSADYLPSEPKQLVSDLIPILVRQCELIVAK